MKTNEGYGGSGSEFHLRLNDTMYLAEINIPILMSKRGSEGYSSESTYNLS